MIRLRLASLAFIGLMPALGGCGNRQPGGGGAAASGGDLKVVQAQLQAIYTAQDAAIARKDSAAFYARCTPDFIETDEQGHTMNLAQDKASFAAICAHSRTIQPSGILRSVKLLAGGRAQAVVDLNVVTTLIEPQGTLETHEAVQDTWVQGPSGWQLAASQVLATRTKASGLVLKSTAPAKK